MSLDYRNTMFSTPAIASSSSSMLPTHAPVFQSDTLFSPPSSPIRSTSRRRRRVGPLKIVESDDDENENEQPTSHPTFEPIVLRSRKRHHPDPDDESEDDTHQSTVRSPVSTPQHMSSVRRRIEPPGFKDHPLPAAGQETVAGPSRTRRSLKTRVNTRPTPKRSGSILLGGGRRTPHTKTYRTRRSSATTHTDLDSIAKEEKSINAEIARLGLKLRDVEGDGNCLFRALADQLWGDQKRHQEVRRVVCQHLEDEGEEGKFGWLVKVGLEGAREAEGYSGYIRRMRELTVFGSDIELQVAACLFNRDIRVIVPGFTLSIAHDYGIAPSDKPRVPPLDVPEPIAGHTNLWLALYPQAEHFQSIRPLHDTTGASLISDKHIQPHPNDNSEEARRQRGEIQPQLQSTSDTATNRYNVDQLLASLPKGHKIEKSHAKGVLERVKGDLGEAVEILLEEITYDTDAEEEEEDEEGRASGTRNEDDDSDGAHSAETSVTTPSDHSGESSSKIKRRLRSRM